VKRILRVLGVALIMAMMMGASALPALAQGPPTLPALPGQAVGNVLNAAAKNPAIDVFLNPTNPDNSCATLTAPPGSGTGHQSEFPNGCVIPG
jgi:hypothetical protein